MNADRRLWLVVWVGACLPAVARGDGFMAPKELGAATSMLASPRQEAILATDGQTIEVVLRTHFRRGPEELAWIVPVPAKPDAVEPANDEVFDALERRTAPRFYLPPAGGWSGMKCGCGAAGWNAAPLGAPGSAVVVERSGTAGVFQYVVLSAKDANELTRWLQDNGYRSPAGAERVFARYVQEGWHWLAMRVRPEMAEQPTLAPHPIRYRYRDSRLVYPLEVSQLSADLESEVLLYVIGTNRYACGNWPNQQIDPNAIRAKAGSPSGTNYEDLVRSATVANQGRLFVTEIARGIGPWDSYDRTEMKLEEALPAPMRGGLRGPAYLTRLRAILTPAAMDRDVLLVPVSGWEEVSNIHYLARHSSGVSAAALAAPLGPIALLACAAAMRRSCRRWRRLALLPAGLGCLALAML